MSGLLLVLLATAVVARFPAARSVQAAAAASSQPPLRDPDEVCAQCHAALVARYRKTPMARGSGQALAGLWPGEFTHAPSGVRYSVFARDGRAWMSFARPGDRAEDDLSGKRELAYFVGSGRHGRTYLYQEQGAWFELPVNWYTRQGRWAMAPAFDGAQHMPAPLPVDANCIHCHASATEEPLKEAGSRFPQRPFDQGGVGCAACHGDPAAHLAAGGHGPILNPAHMTPAARDSACVQCHLEGDAVVYRPGRSLAQFMPGQVLSDVALYFVRGSQTGGGQRASSQYEALLKSACKRASGDRLTCTTCHDPHGDPEPAQRVAFFRARCLQCHTSPALATAHHPEQPDCAACHMPSRQTADISHEQVTDHDVERVPAHPAPRTWTEGEELVPVGNATAGPRELGLAYAQRAQKGDRKAAQRGLQLLLRAEAEGADDPSLHVYLGYLEQVAGRIDQARREYGLALRQDPFSATALTNRAVLDAGSGDLPEAVRLLDRLLQADPSQTPAGLDLLKLECRAGETERVRTLLGQLRAMDPDDEELRAFTHTTAAGTLCSAKGLSGTAAPGRQP